MTLNLRPGRASPRRQTKFIPWDRQAAEELLADHDPELFELHEGTKAHATVMCIQRALALPDNVLGLPVQEERDCVLVRQVARVIEKWADAAERLNSDEARFNRTEVANILRDIAKHFRLCAEAAR